MKLPLMKTHLTLLRENNGLTLAQLVDHAEKLVLLSIEWIKLKNFMNDLRPKTLTSPLKLKQNGQLWKVLKEVLINKLG